MTTKIDPITRSVVQYRLSSIVEEMGEAMLRTSYSQILNSSRDFSLAICDTRGRLIAQADHIPVHVGALPWATLAVEERFSGDIRRGDVILLNDPYHGGSHLPDLTAFVPIVEAAMEAILDATEQQTRAVVSSWKDGVFQGEAFLDDDGHGRNDIRIAAKVTKRGSDVEVDLSASDAQSTSFVNSSHANMQAAVAMAFAYLIDADIPKNSGALRPLKVVAEQGTVVWADPGRPVTLCTSHPSNEIVEAIIKALSASCPDRAMAGWGRRFRIAIQGEDPRTGKNFIWHMFQARPGGGASAGGGGCSSIGEWHSVGGIKFGSIEVAEVRFPLHFRHHEFRAGSGGDGQFRGGLGVALDLVLETEKPARGNTAGDGARHGPCGMLGGEGGHTHCYRLLSEGREPRVLRTKEVGVEIRPGDCLEIRSSGGGGWGPPARRSDQARRRDREQGLVGVAPERRSS